MNAIAPDFQINNSAASEPGIVVIP